MKNHILKIGVLCLGAILVAALVFRLNTTLQNSKLANMAPQPSDDVLVDKPVICLAGKPSAPFYIADRVMDLPMDMDIIVWPGDGTKTVIRLTDQKPHLDMSNWRLIRVQLPVDYVFTPRLKKR